MTHAQVPVAAGETGDGAGRLEAWRREILRYVHRLTADADVAEDIAQEAMVRLLSVDASRLHNRRAWLYRVATNLVRDRARREELRLRRPPPVDTDPPATPDQELERRDEIARVRRALDALPPRDRELLVLRESGFRHREIANVIGVQPQSVSMLALRALERFRAAYVAEEMA